MIDTLFHTVYIKVLLRILGGVFYGNKVLDFNKNFKNVKLLQFFLSFGICIIKLHL